MAVNYMLEMIEKFTFKLLVWNLKHGERKIITVIIIIIIIITTTTTITTLVMYNSSSFPEGKIDQDQGKH